MIRRVNAQANPTSAKLAEQAKAHWHNGVPMHWMLDWSTPFPLFAKEAKGATLTDVDGHSYDDFCLGDTGSMFGHSPEPIVRAIRRVAVDLPFVPTTCTERNER